MILLENAEMQKKHYEKKCEDMAYRLRETEKSLQALQKEVATYRVSLALIVCNHHTSVHDQLVYVICVGYGHKLYMPA